MNRRLPKNGNAHVLQMGSNLFNNCTCVSERQFVDPERGVRPNRGTTVQRLWCKMDTQRLVQNSGTTAGTDKDA